MIEFENSGSTLEKQFKLHLIEAGWGTNIYEKKYFSLEKIVKPNENFSFYFLLYLKDIPSPVALAYIIQDWADDEKLHLEYLELTKKINCPTIIRTDLLEFTISNKDSSFENTYDYFSIPEIDLSIIYSDFITKKCNSLLTYEQDKFIEHPFFGKILKFYNTEINQTCIILIQMHEVYNNNYSIPEFALRYKVIDESGTVLINTQREYEIKPYLKFAILLYENLR